MRENNRNSIEKCRKKLPQFTTMNVIDGQAGLISYFSLIFYSLTIDNILNIIVLLILAGVSIATLTGKNGILTQAQIAKRQTEITNEEEKLRLAVSGALLKDKGKLTQTSLENELENYFDRSDFTVTSGTNESGEEGFIVTITENIEEGRKYFVNTKGEMIEYEETQVADLTDIYVSLYSDGSLVFSNNSETIDGKTLEKSYGNIKDKIFEVKEFAGDYMIDLPWFELDNLSNMEELQHQFMKIKKVIIANKIVPKNVSYWFSFLMNLKEIENIENLDTSNVTDMNAMFFNCIGLTNLNLSNFNTSNVTYMNDMFFNCIGLTNLNLSNFNTNNVTNMSGMFSDCTGLTNLNLSNFNTSNVTYMNDMFFNCIGLTNLNLSNFNTSNVTDMSGMFHNCARLTNLNLSNFNTSNVTDMSSMFGNCPILNTSNNLGITNWNVNNVMNFEAMFSANISGVTWNTIDISKWNISQNANIRFMFQGHFTPYLTVYVKDDEIKSRFENDSTQSGENYVVK